MHPSVAAIYQRGIWLQAHGLTETGPQLVNHLKVSGIVAPSGKPYGVGRGIYRAIDAAESVIKKTYGKPEAEKISMSFTNTKGKFAYRD